MTHAIPKVVTTLSQRSVEQGEGKSPVIFDTYLDETSSHNFRKMIKEKIREFSVAIQLRTGYHVLLRKQQSKSERDTEILYVDIRQAKQSYVFILTDHDCEYHLYREA